MKEPSEKKAIIKKMMKEGKTYKQISEETGICYGTVGIYGGKLKKAEREKKCFNGDRHLCRTCKYRASGARSGCDYIIYTGNERGCNPEVCNKYEKGNRNETKTSSKGK